ncbi:tetratricopeptide repeat protein [Magnetospirillum sp. SS-4]|uniref:O-linked N-acetylglucosamine transferase, SPINDLY family protein n=1 Tax=Magnetospirillum sp. SS-4 TaxID=2681465 RepID=UPI00137D199B|nr:tetratricopeptide repeat protein [Magnetospirillum sp. SS-4]CAA7619872.1 conserved hypothetical protein [Magnetospirillum sp. SS-4]
MTERLRLLLATALEAHQRGDAAGALEAGRQLAALMPAEAFPLHFQGEVLAGLGRLPEALEAFARAAELAPAEPSHRRALALVAMSAGHPGLAARHLGALAAPEPADMANLADALAAAGDAESAVAAYGRLLELRPDSVDVLVALSGQLIALGRHAEAVAALDRALILAPDDPDALTNLALVRLAGDEPERAEVLARRAAGRPDPGLAALLALASALQRQGRGIEALEVAETAAGRVGRDEPNAAAALASSLAALGRADEAAGLLRRSLAAHPAASDRLVERLLFVLPHLEDAVPADLLALTGLLDTPAPTPATVAAETRWREGERLRIGYLSPDFRGHALAYFLAPLLEGHDRRRVEVVCYCETRVEDAWTERFRRQADVWRVSLGRSDRELAERIRADGVHVLIDCAGRTAGNRLGVMKWRSAPVQGSMLLGGGMTTGLAGLDFILTDCRLSPPGGEDGFAEPLLRLPHAVAPFAPDPAWPEVFPMPDRPVFGCLANPARLNDGLLACWRRILDSCPGWSLLLAHPAYAGAGMAAYWRGRLDAAGLAGRAELRPLGPNWAMDVYGEVAIILDTFPVSGATTSLIGLWMGVPVVSRHGSAPWQRFGLAILSDIGLGDLSAAGADGYVDAARRLAEDRDRLAVLRAGLRERLRRSPLCDTAARARDVEDALLGLMRRRGTRGEEGRA